MNSGDYLSKLKRKKVIKLLKNSSPERFEKIAEKKIIPSFKRAVDNSPAYRDVLSRHSIDSTKINTLSEFINRVPILEKKDYFNQYSLDQLAGNKLSKIKLAMTSSGFSGNFAYGLSSKSAVNKTKFGVDTSFDYCFDISNRKTFLINCEPMGVHIETSMPIAETSVRSDMAIALLKKVSPCYDQTILIGDPYFMKKLVEEGDAEKINWKALNVSLVTGQDWLPESLRSYLAERLKIDLDADLHRSIITTMGMTELGLNVFHESFQLIKLRREIAKNARLKRLLTNSEMKAPPFFYHYYPFSTYAETVIHHGVPELIFTSLDKDSIIPIIRYSTGDSGIVMKYADLIKRLGRDYQNFAPDLKLPIGILYGRSKNKITSGKHSFYLEDIKEGLFLNTEVASSITGLIQCITRDEIPLLVVHLQKGVKESEKLRKLIMKTVSAFLIMDINVQLKAYGDFPNALELSYEHKLFV